jgi:methyl-accepting chemotaxis protein
VPPGRASLTHGRVKNHMDDPSLLSKFQSSFQELATAAAELNQVSDQLTESVAELEAAITSLRLGVSCWVDISEAWNDRWRHQLGYEKISGKWGLAVRIIDNSQDRIDNEWLFADSPRDLRVEAVDRIPKLLEGLSAQVTATKDRIAAKVEGTRQLSSAIATAAKQEQASRIVAANIVKQRSKGGK